MSQGILLDFPITYQIPTPGSRSFSTSRGDLINKLEEIGDRWVENHLEECRQSAENAESFTWPAFFSGLDLMAMPALYDSSARWLIGR